jgi:hypothetical protein
MVTPGSPTLPSSTPGIDPHQVGERREPITAVWMGVLLRATQGVALGQRIPCQKARSRDRGSSTRLDVVSKRMVALRLRS